MSPTIRVLVVERDPLFRRGVAALLEGNPDMELAGSAGSAAEGFRLTEEQQPDVILIGTTLPDAPGLTAATEMRRRFPALATIVTAPFESDDELFAAIRAGASAYCGKDIPEEALLQMIRRAASGEYVINEQLLERPSVAVRVIEQFRAASGDIPAQSAYAPLTDRELEILGKISTGLTNAEIGYALGISPQTVKNHVTSIMRKMAVNDRTQAVVMALRRGWIHIDETRQDAAGHEAASTPATGPNRPGGSRGRDGQR